MTCTCLRDLHACIGKPGVDKCIACVFTISMDIFPSFTFTRRPRVSSSQEQSNRGNGGREKRVCTVSVN